jgi:hypothetical protein
MQQKEKKHRTRGAIAEMYSFAHLKLNVGLTNETFQH